MAVEMAVVKALSIELATGVGVQNSCHSLIPSYSQTIWRFIWYFEVQSNTSPECQFLRSHHNVSLRQLSHCSGLIAPSPFTHPQPPLWQSWLRACEAKQTPQ